MGVVACTGEDLGLRGDILKRYEAQAGPHSIFPFGKPSNYDNQGCKVSLEGKDIQAKQLAVHGEQLCKFAIEVLEQVRFGWREQEPGTYSKVSRGFLSAFGKVQSSTPNTPTPRGTQWECVGWWQTSNCSSY